MDNVSVNIRETHVPPAEAIRHLFVIHTEQMKHRGMQVMDLNFVFNGFVAEFISSTVDRSTFYAAACHPQRETKRIVVPTVSALSKRCSSKLSRPDNQS